MTKRDSIRERKQWENERAWE